MKKIILGMVLLSTVSAFAGDTYNCSFTYLIQDQPGINAEIKVEATDGFKEDSVVVPELNKILSVTMEKTKDSARKGAHDVHVRLHDKNESFPVDPSKEIILIGSLSKKSKYIYLSSHIYGTSYVFQCEKQ